jgi:hypothetical protein
MANIFFGEGHKNSRGHVHTQKQGRENNWLWLSQDCNQSVYQFELLRSASIQEGLDPLSNIPFVVFPFERQQDARGEAESLSHRHDGIEAWNLLSTFHISPEIRGYVAAFGGLL